MDATYTTTFRKFALLFSIALLLAAPFAAQGQPQFTSGLTATLDASGHGCVRVTGTNDSSAPITFTANQVIASGQPVLTIDPPGGNTPATICFAIFSGASTQTTTVTLKASNPTGVANGSIAVTWNPNGSGGGNGGTTGSGMTATLPTNPLQMSSYSGVQGQVSFTLNNTTASFMTFQTAVTYSTGSNWLTAPGSGPVPANSNATVTLYGNPGGLLNTIYSATVTITYSGSLGQGTITIPVQFTVGNNTSGNGNLTFSPSPVTLSYTSGGTSAPSQTVSLITSAATFNAVASSTGNWLLVGGQSAVYGASVSNGMFITTVSPTTSNFPSAGASGTIQVTDSNGNSAYLTVNLVYNGQSNNGLTISPSPVSLSASVGGATVQQTLSVTSTVAANLSVTNYNGTGISAQLQSSSVNAGGTVYLTVYGNPSGLSANTYQGSVTVSNTGVSPTVSTTVYVTFTVGSGNPATSGSVLPTSLQFNYELGLPPSGSSSSLVAQNIYDSVAGAYTTSVTSGSSWLSVPASGTGPAPIAVSVSNPPTTAGSYTGSFNIQTVAGTQAINVTLLVSANPVVFSTWPVVYFSYAVNGDSNSTYQFQVYSSDSSDISITGTSPQSWLTATQIGSTTPATFNLTLNPTSLSNGLNLADVIISSSAANGVLTVPVVVNVSGSTVTPPLTFGSTSLTFNTSVGSPQSQNLSVTASISTAYTLTASGVSNGITWLSVSPAGALNTSSTSSVTVTASPTGLSAGTYVGSLSFATSNGTQTVGVTMNVGTNGTGSVFVSPTTALSFNYASGGSVPAAQMFNVLNSNPTAGAVNFNVTVAMANGTGWLVANPTSGTAGSQGIPISVSVTPSALSAGTYTGTVSVSPGNASIPVTLVVTGLPTVSASPASINLNYQAGSSSIPSSTIQVTGSASNLSFAATASTTSGGNWLTVSPQSGTTGTSGTALTVSISPSGLSAGSYSGTIVVAGNGGAAGSTTVNVTLTVTAPLPTIAAVINAASGASGAVSPGEIVSIFAPSSGANPIGPGTPAYLTLDSSKANVLTTLGGVQVLFSGIPAPLLYVSATQINCVVPYGIAGLSLPFVQVKYLGQNSNAFNLTATSTAPGMFTQSNSGTGPGAILNADNNVNGTGHPAAKGSVIQIFMTGEGATNPPGVTGSVTCANGCSSISQIPVPLLPVAITFVDSAGNHYGANYTFAGEAPGDVAGVFQVNAVVPTTVPSGTLQIYVTVGGNSSQSGVTVQVQ